ncbi:MAG: hypothetical protein JW746_10590 [Candidatus Krumholzibacteriota bacterium]|nr:hypothetical protein [Candidatus Krumholzibacteriota bacterium]
MKNKTFFLTISVAISVLSVLTGAHIIPGTGLAGVILAFLAIFAIPGAYITLLCSGSLPLTVDGVCRVFFTGIIYATFMVSLGFIPGVGYAFISVASGVISVLLALLYHLHFENRRNNERKVMSGRFRREDELSTKEQRTMLSIIIVMLALCFIFFESTGELGLSSDALDHVSFIRRSIESDTILPSDSFYKEGDGAGVDPRKGLWDPVLSLWAFQADSAPEYLWSMVPSFFAFFALITFWFYTKELLGTIRLTLFASVLFLIFMEGSGVIWLTKIAYSKNISTVLLWGTAGYIVRYMRMQERRDFIMASFLVVVGIAYHVVFGYLFFSLAAAFFIYVALIPCGRRWFQGFKVIVPVLTGAAAAALVIRVSFFPGVYNMIHTHRQGLLLIGERFLTVDPVELLNRMGLVFFFIIVTSPIVFFRPEKKGLPILTGVLFLFPVLTVINPFTATLAEGKLGYLFYRMIYAAPAMSMLALILTYLGRLFVSGRLSVKKRYGAGGTIAARTVSLLTIIIFIALPLRFAFSGTVAETGNILKRDSKISMKSGKALKDLTEGLPAGSVVMADPATSYLLSAYTDLFVVVTLGQHGSPSDPEGLKRIEVIRDQFDPALPVWRNLEWLKKKKVEYLIIGRYQSETADFFKTVPLQNIPMMLELVEESGPVFSGIGEEEGYILFKLNIDEMENLRISDSERREISVLECEEPESIRRLSGDEYEWEGIRLVSVDFEKTVLLPGDTLSGSFCWNLPDTIEFGLPYEWTMRIDTEFPKGGFFMPWYGKQYRRIIERRNNTFYRFTANGRIRSGTVTPERWQSGVDIREDFDLVLPDSIAFGGFEVRIAVQRAAYLPNRRISDYLRNNDSLSGPVIGIIQIGKRTRMDNSLLSQM